MAHKRPRIKSVLSQIHYVRDRLNPLFRKMRRDINREKKSPGSVTDWETTLATIRGEIILYNTLAGLIGEDPYTLPDYWRPKFMDHRVTPY